MPLAQHIRCEEAGGAEASFVMNTANLLQDTYNAAVNAVRSGQMVEARAQAEKALSLAPDNLQVSLLFTEIIIRMGEVREAVAPVSYTHLTLPTTPYV